MRLTAKVAFTYGRKALRPGDPFEATAADAKTLTALGKAIDPEQAVLLKPKEKRKYKRRDMEAE